jgi:hypothetical protein
MDYLKQSRSYEKTIYDASFVDKKAVSVESNFQDE